MRVAVRRTATAAVGRGATVTKAVAVHMQDLEEGEAEGEEEGGVEDERQEVGQQQVHLGKRQSHPCTSGKGPS